MGDGAMTQSAWKAAAQNCKGICCAPTGRSVIGALAASGRLPISAEAFEVAIPQRRQGVESNLRGFSRWP